MSRRIRAVRCAATIRWRGARSATERGHFIPRSVTLRRTTTTRCSWSTWVGAYYGRWGSRADEPTNGSWSRGSVGAVVAAIALVARILLIAVRAIVATLGAAALLRDAALLFSALLRIALLFEAALLVGSLMLTSALSLEGLAPILLAPRGFALLIGATLGLAVLLEAELVCSAILPIASGGAQIGWRVSGAILAQLTRLVAEDHPAVMRAVVPAALHEVRGAAAVHHARIVFDARRYGFDVLGGIVRHERTLGVRNAAGQRGGQREAQAEGPDRAPARGGLAERPKALKSHVAVRSNRDANGSPSPRSGAEVLRSSRARATIERDPRRPSRPGRA